MDDRLRERLDGAQRAAANAAYGVCRMTESVISAARLRLRLRELEAEAEARLTEAGRMVYATHTGTPTPSEVLLEKLREIDGLEDQITALRREGGLWRCGACGAENQEGDRFCRECGRRL